MISPRAISVLHQARKVFSRFNKPAQLLINLTGQAASDYIKTLLNNSSPCLICRFGMIELQTTLRHIDISRKATFIYKAFEYICGKSGPFWWDDALRKAMFINAGFFPTTDFMLSRFGDKMLESIKQSIDVLGSWVPGEERLSEYLTTAKITQLRNIEPYYHSNPWSAALKGKKVLVIHPFDRSISSQYLRRNLLFANPDVLPDFDLQTFRPTQSIAGTNTGFTNWFDALDWMCKRISLLSFDVAIIGAGAYGLPLAAFIKKLGKKAIHLGGATQVFFGIYGARWEIHPVIKTFINEYWVRPLPEERPPNANLVESGCYW
jgi:hypothetical protein